jgi:hypothetical protein
MRARSIAATALGLLLVVAGTWWWVDYQRTSDFLWSVDQSGVGWRSSDLPGVARADQEWLSAHHDKVLAAGEASCRWLESQPAVATVVPSGEATVGAVRTRYVQATAGAPVLEVHPRTFDRVVTLAWAYLCRDIVESRTSPEVRGFEGD